MNIECKEFSLSAAEEQEALASKVSLCCESGSVIFLEGDLGTGKTTFVRGFLRGLGHTGVVKSPTYTLVESYVVGSQRIFHFDLYRLADPEELEYAGGRDYFDGQAICLVEWPDKAAGFLPQADIRIQIQYEGSGRKLRMCSQTARGSRLLQHISY